MKPKIYDTFDGELLFTCLEVDLTVCMDDDGIHIYLRDVEVTDELTEKERQNITDDFNVEAASWAEAQKADRADWEYDNARDAAAEKAFSREVTKCNADVSERMQKYSEYE